MTVGDRPGPPSPGPDPDIAPLVTVIGVGNPYRRDDGAAGTVLARLAPLVDPATVRLVELDGEPARMVAVWEGSRSVWVIDAIRSGRPPGTVQLLTGEALAADAAHRDRGPRVGVRVGGGHLFGVRDAVALARALGRLPERLVIVGIEGADFGDGVGLTPAVAEGCRVAAIRVAAAITAASPRPSPRPESGRQRSAR